MTKTGYYAPESLTAADLVPQRVNPMDEISEVVQSSVTFDSLGLSIVHVVRHPDSNIAELTVLLKSTHLRWQATNDGRSGANVTVAAVSLSGRGRGVISMMVVLLIAGIGILLAGLLGIGFGIPVKEFSFGNTLIVTGVVAACTGMIMLSLWAIVRELKNLALQAGSGVASTSRAGTRESDGFPFGRDQAAVAVPGDAEPAAAPSALSPPPWQDEAASRERARTDPPPVPAPAEAASAAKQRRNLLFSSSSRKERERAEARTADPSAADVRSPLPTAPPPPKPSEAPPPPPATFDDAWPQLERSRSAETPLQRRSGRAPSTFTEPSAGAPGPDRYSPAARSEEHPPVTVLKSGVVDGMAYSLYSDGSIEAQLPEGMMRFASIDELRAHLDQRQ